MIPPVLSPIGKPVHYILLSAEITICEDMRNLQALPPSDFTITAVPPAGDLESFPVRIFATISEKINKRIVFYNVYNKYKSILRKV